MVSSACLASAVVNGCGSRASLVAAAASAPGASTIWSFTRNSSPARAAAAIARVSSLSARSRPDSGAMNGARSRSASTARTAAATGAGSAVACGSCRDFCGSGDG